MTIDMGVVGLGVMGANLARNIESRGFSVIGYDVDAAKTKAFLDGPARGTRIDGRRAGRTGRGAGPAAAGADHGPRRSGGGQRRLASAAALRGGRHADRRRQFLFRRHRSPDGWAREGRPAFLGTGVSGGEEGALRGPSIMPGGSRPGWEAMARSSRPSPPKPRMAIRAWRTWGRAAPGTT